MVSSGPFVRPKLSKLEARAVPGVKLGVPWMTAAITNFKAITLPKSTKRRVIKEGICSCAMSWKMRESQKQKNYDEKNEALEKLFSL